MDKYIHCLVDKYIKIWVISQYKKHVQFFYSFSRSQSRVRRPNIIKTRADTETNSFGSAKMKTNLLPTGSTEQLFLFRQISRKNEVGTGTGCTSLI
jgi:hypothetical protein